MISSTSGIQSGRWLLSRFTPHTPTSLSTSIMIRPADKTKKYCLLCFCTPWESLSFVRILRCIHEYQPQNPFRGCWPIRPGDHLYIRFRCSCRLCIVNKTVHRLVFIGHIQQDEQCDVCLITVKIHIPSSFSVRAHCFVWSDGSTTHCASTLHRFYAVILSTYLSMYLFQQNGSGSSFRSIFI